jgi:hypothetical protein
MTNSLSTAVHHSTVLSSPPPHKSTIVADEDTNMDNSQETNHSSPAAVPTEEQDFNIPTEESYKLLKRKIKEITEVSQRHIKEIFASYINFFLFSKIFP